MSSSLFGATGGGGGGASSAFFFGIAYGPTLSVGPPASAGTSCLGFPLSGVWVWEAGGWLCWSCAATGKVPHSSAKPIPHTKATPERLLLGPFKVLSL